MVQTEKQKKKKEDLDDFEIKFWKDWLEADVLKRFDLVKNLPMFKMCLKMEDSKMWKHSFTSLLNGYFEDLESAVYTKTRLEDKQRRKEV